MPCADAAAECPSLFPTGTVPVFVRVPVRTTSFEQPDAAAQVDEFLPIGEVPQQILLEIDQPDVEDEFRSVQRYVLTRRGFETFGAGACRNQYVDPEIVSDDLTDDRPQRQDRDVEVLLVRRTRAGSTAACEESRKKQGEICVFHVRFHGRPERQKSLRYLRAKVIIIAIFSSDIVPIFVAVAVIRCFETGVCETACGRTDSVFSGCGVPVRAGGLIRASGRIANLRPVLRNSSSCVVMCPAGLPKRFPATIVRVMRPVRNLLTDDERWVRQE